MVLALVVALQEFVNPDSGPEQTGGFEVDPKFFIALFLAGMVIGAAGHLYKSKTLITIGVLFVMLATLFIPLALAITR